MAAKEKNSLPPRTNLFKDCRGKWRIAIRIDGGKKKTIVSGASNRSEAITQFHLPQNYSVFQALLSGTAITITANAVGRNSVAAAINAYFKSPKFTGTRPATQALYRTAVSGIQKDHGHRSLIDLDRKAARFVIEEVGARSPALANTARSVMSTIMKRAIDDGLRESNPFDKLDRYELGSHHTWTEEQIAKFEKRWPIGTRERMAFALMLYTAQRGASDVRRMRRSMIIDGWISQFKQVKTGNIVDIPLHPNLIRVIEGTKGDDYLVDAIGGGETTPPAFMSMMARAIDEAKLPKECVPHGLRKAACRRLAELGATTHQIMSISGHKSMAEIERYTSAASQHRMAEQAMALIADDTDKASLMIEHQTEGVAA